MTPPRAVEPVGTPTGARPLPGYPRRDLVLHALLIDAKCLFCDSGTLPFIVPREGGK